MLLSGNPAFSKPMELWPQLFALNTWWKDKDDYRTRFCGKELSNKRQHMILNTLLLGTVMMRRTKAEVMSSLPPKRQYQYAVNMSNADKDVLKSIKYSRARILCGNGQMAALNRETNSVSEDELETILLSTQDSRHQNVIECYMNTRILKAPSVVSALKAWLQHPKNGKVCIFAHHSQVLNIIQEGAGLTTKISIRIDKDSPHEAVT